MGRIGMGEIVLIVVVIMLLFGVKRLPEIGRALAKAIKEFKKASRDIEEDIKDAIEDDPNGNSK